MYDHHSYNFRTGYTIYKWQGKADFDLADSNAIYRMGVTVQVNLTFELAWKVLQEVLRMYGVEGAETGSPREILQVGYKVGFVNDSSVWLLMLKKEIHRFIYITRKKLMN